MTSQTEFLESALPQGPPRGESACNWLPVRALSERHRDRVLKHLLTLPSRDRQLRFGQNASDEQLGHYVQGLDFVRDEICGVFDRRLELVALAHLAFGGGAAVPEFGVSVHPRLRGRGIGGRLFEHAIRGARNRGAHSLAIHIARDNTAMLSIVRRAGALVEFDGSDATAELGLTTDTLGSHIGALVDSQAADIDYRFKLQVLRLDRLWPDWMSSRGRNN